MNLLIDRTNLQIVAAASKSSHMALIMKHLFPGIERLLVSTEDGRGWTELSSEEMGVLYFNCAKMDAPDYGTAIDHLRMYGRQWTDYPVSEAELTKLDEQQAIPGPIEQEPEYDPQNPGVDPSEGDEPYVAFDEESEPEDNVPMVGTIRQSTFQAIVDGVQKDNARIKAEGGSEAQPTAQAAAKPAKVTGEAKAPSKPGATKRVWDIADSKYAIQVPTAADIKMFRKAVIDACEAEGINAGTAATQFGKWKASKGL